MAVAEHWAYEPPDPQTIGINAMDVVWQMRTRSQPKGHGQFEFYEDDRIRIRASSFCREPFEVGFLFDGGELPFDAIEVSVPLEGEWEVVYSAPCRMVVSPSIHRSGLWQMYLTETLWPKAQNLYEERIEAEDRKDDGVWQERYTPIDDTAIFEDMFRASERFEVEGEANP